MSKGAKIALFSFLVVLVVVLVFALKPSGGQQPSLKIPGWHKGPAQVDKAEKDGPIDKIVISFKGQTLTATRDAKDKSLWHLARPKGARADNYKVRSVLNLFKDDIETDFSSKLDDSDIKAFGFDKDDAIRVTLYKGADKVVDLEIGASQKNGSQGEANKDTWVRKPGAKLAFRVLGKDMRYPFGQDLSRFRDRQVFAFKQDDIMRVEISNPSAKLPRDRRIVLQAEVSKPANKGKKDAKKAEKPKKTWHIQIPAGYKIGDISSYLSRIANLYAQEFPQKLPKDVKFDKPFVIKVKLQNKTLKTIEISGNYAKVAGLEGYIKLSEYAAKGLKKGINEFRDKHVWNAPRETIKRVEIATDKGRMVLQRTGNVWRFVEPKGLKLNDDKRDRLLKDIEQLTVSDFVKPTPKVLSNADFAKPYVRCRIELDDNRTLELVISSKKNKDGQRYAKATGQKEILVLSSYMAAKLHKTAKDLEQTKKSTSKK